MIDSLGSSVIISVFYLHNFLHNFLKLKNLVFLSISHYYCHLKDR